MVHLHFALNSKMRDKMCAMGLTIPTSYMQHHVIAAKQIKCADESLPKL